MFFESHLIILKPLKLVLFLLENFLCFLFVCYFKAMFPSHTDVMLRILMLGKDTYFDYSLSLNSFQKFRMFLFDIKTKLFPVHKGNFATFN